MKNAPVEKVTIWYLDQVPHCEPCALGLLRRQENFDPIRVGKTHARAVNEWWRVHCCHCGTPLVISESTRAQS